MSKFGIIASLVAIVGGLSLATLTGSASADPPAPCVRKDFKTDLVKQACTTGGQPAAKDAMKKWNKDHNITSCNKCHSKLAPNYELKTDGFDQYTKLGGK